MNQNIELIQALGLITMMLVVGGVVFIVLAFAGVWGSQASRTEWERLCMLDEVESSPRKTVISRLVVISLLIIGLCQLFAAIWLGLVLYLL